MLLIGNGKLYTRDSENPFIENGCVYVENNTIKEVGSTQLLKEKFSQAEFIDAKGQIIMPGFINIHDHAYSALARGMSINNYSPNSFIDILEGLWWKLDNKLTLEDSKYSAMATFLDSIKFGVTTVFDHHASYKETSGSLFEIAQAAKDIGIRACLCYEVSDRNGKEEMLKAVKENVDFIESLKGNNSDMLAGMMGLHAAFTLSDETLDYCRAKTPDNCGFHIHVAEGISDVYDSLQNHGKRVVNRLFDHGIMGKNTLAAHCIHINPAEIDIIKETETMVVHNPESNMGNAVGCGSVVEMFKRGILIGLGTDGFTHDMTESLKVGNIIHKHNLCDPKAGGIEIPAMLFENNRKIVSRFFKRPTGIIKEGACADIIICDYDPLTPMNENNLNGHILFGMNGKNVVTTIANGKVLMKDRKVLCIDEKEVFAKCRELAKKLWNRINA